MKKINIFLSIVLMLFGFYANAQTTCAAPVITANAAGPTAGTTLQSAIVNWPIANYPVGTYYSVQYKKPADSIWVTVIAQAVPYTINGLAPCTEYQIRAKANCSPTSMSLNSNQVAITTQGCPNTAVCNAPTGLIATPFTSLATVPNNQGFTLSWATMGYPTGTAYIIEYKKTAATVWNTTTASVSPRNIDGLEPCTEYQFRMKAVCSSTSTSAYSVQIAATTLGCTAPCVAPSITAGLSGTSGTVAVANWTTFGYPTGTTYTLSYKKNTDSTWTNVTATSSPYTVGNLATCTEYLFKVKANCSATSSSAYSNQVGVLTSGCPAPCIAPFITVSGGTTTSGAQGAYITWTTANYPAGTTYTIEYKKNTATTWTTATATTSPFAISGLDVCTEYQFRIKANCSATSSSPYSNQAAILTAGCPVPCVAPILTVGLSGTTGNAATAAWTVTNTMAGVTYTVEYKKNTSTVWIASTVTTTTFTVGNLDACSEYQFRVKANCSATSSSAYSNQAAVQTTGCPLPCVAPIVAAQASQTPGATTYTATTTWPTANYASGTTYTVSYKKNTDSTWTNVTATSSPYAINGLMPCSEYLIKVKANCSATSSSAYSNTFAIQTGGCPTPCLAPQGVVATPTPNSPNTSKGAIVNWITATYAAGTTYTVEYKKNTATTWTVATATSSPYTVIGLDSCAEYQFRIKANCSATSSSPYSLQTATLTAGNCNPLPSCAAPLVTAAVNPTISAISGTIAWNAAAYPAGTLFIVEYKKNTSTTWTVANSASTTSPLTISTGLTSCTEYQVRVKAVCSATSSSAYSNIAAFTTVGCPPPCVSPNQLTLSAISNNSAVATWNNTGAASYTLQYRPITFNTTTTPTWITVNNITGNTYTFANLTTCKYYYVRVSANCTGTATPTGGYLVTKAFKTLGCILGPVVTYDEKLIASPNPGSNVLTVQYMVENEGNTTIQMLNTQGQLVKNLVSERLSSGVYQNTFDEVSDLSAGLYFIVLRNENGEKFVQRWMKQ
jgi:Secretion system C-terminal sorting domain